MLFFDVLCCAASWVAVPCITAPIAFEGVEAINATGVMFGEYVDKLLHHCSKRQLL